MALKTGQTQGIEEAGALGGESVELIPFHLAEANHQRKQDLYRYYIEAYEQDWRRRGWSQRAFCEHLGVPVHRFHYWRRDLGFNGGGPRRGPDRLKKPRDKDEVSFIAVQVASGGQQQRQSIGRGGSLVAVELRRSGHRVYLEDGSSMELLKRVVAALELP